MSINNCEQCKHKQHSNDGHCSVFRIEPQTPCAQHSVRAFQAMNVRMIHAIKTQDRMNASQKLLVTAKVQNQLNMLRNAAQQARDVLQATEDDYGSNSATIAVLTEALKESEND